jgi:hypothetical protein
MTKAQNVVATWYLLLSATFGGFVFQRFSAFLFIAFTLAFVLKVVNSVSGVEQHIDVAPLIAAPAQKKEELNERANTIAGCES